MKKGFALLVAPAAMTIATALMPYGNRMTALAATGKAGTEASVAAAGAQDLGPTDEGQVITASLVLKVRNQNALAAYIQDVSTPGSPQYRCFLSVAQFKRRYAPSDSEIAAITRYLETNGLRVREVYPDNLLLKVEGTAEQFNTVFDTTLHNYVQRGHHFYAPTRLPRMPKALSDSVLAIVGLDTQALARPMSARTAQVDGQPARVVLPKGGSTATGVPQDYTVGDVANLYDVNPLYQHGITGKGQTVGIVTLADFEPSDAYTYWDTIGLKYKPNRITQVHVDGGGPLSAEDGSGETTLDVEQAGGLAPDADILVYDAPNTDAGFIDAFYKAISANLADSLSVSWGLPEVLYNAELNGGVDYTSELQAFHQVFMEAAVQGQSLFASSGDAGAYDVNGVLPYPAFSKVVSVDSPAADPYVTAAGGTTVPATLTLSKGTVTIEQERAWAWDYLLPLGYDESILFPVGDGGGVSTYWSLPWYQRGLAGIARTPAGQSVVDNGTSPPQDYYDLPAHFAGRNLPDLSMNADPETGYLVYSTPDGGWIAGYGGTSFVAPQFNGIAALLDQSVHGRVGLWNPLLYTIARSGSAYGPQRPFNDITAGDNWYWQGTQGYDQATGIGTPNVANLDKVLTGLVSESHHGR
ncbi:S53 family peptidase [Alicyclobacillus shizuokensis]|uniref:S53 family peptidase n=1 Tax=Alicyclobacillus shizuokensis TaxID=392014 RepID=UPI000AF80183|nr:S53 family peptidase [Alicyclobacillus shizuokensis]